jgi:hypothetical protein
MLENLKILFPGLKKRGILCTILLALELFIHPENIWI